MSSKRKFPDSEADDDVHVSRKSQIYGHHSKPAKKPYQNQSPVYKKQAHASSVNAIKKRIRDVTRKLERSENLPADLRAEDERALAAYQQELAAAEAEKLKQKMIKRYHMVRFFERQKATRQLKKLRKCLIETQSTDEVEILKEQIRLAEVDLSYTQYCPLGEPYISLYPKKTSTTDVENGKTTEQAAKPAMWAEVNKCMKEGTLDQLRNRISSTNVPTPPRPLKIKPPKLKPVLQAAAVDTTGMNRRERRRQRTTDPSPSISKHKSIAHGRNLDFGVAQAEDRDDSDGGFFEE